MARVNYFEGTYNGKKDPRVEKLFKAYFADYVNQGEGAWDRFWRAGQVEEETAWGGFFRGPLMKAASADVLSKLAELDEREAEKKRLEDEKLYARRTFSDGGGSKAAGSAIYELLRDYNMTDKDAKELVKHINLFSKSGTNEWAHALLRDNAGYGGMIAYHLNEALESGYLSEDQRQELFRNAASLMRADGDAYLDSLHGRKVVNRGTGWFDDDRKMSTLARKFGDLSNFNGLIGEKKKAAEEAKAAEEDKAFADWQAKLRNFASTHENQLRDMGYNVYEGMSDAEISIAKEQEKLALRRRPDGTLITEEDLKKNIADRDIMWNNLLASRAKVTEGATKWRQEKQKEEEALDNRRKEEARLYQAARDYAAKRTQGYHPATGVPMNEIFDYDEEVNKYMERAKRAQALQRNTQSIADSGNGTQAQAQQPQYSRGYIRKPSNFDIRSAEISAQWEFDRDNRHLRPSQRDAALRQYKKDGRFQARAGDIYRRRTGRDPAEMGTAAASLEALSQTHLANSRANQAHAAWLVKQRENGGSLTNNDF